ncbi:MAG: sugar ABC transporter permease [Alphaproteobacteria bacterium]|nr:sugar ABC transporter permease [Alphaproteobacteria bacterium]
MEVKTVAVDEIPEEHESFLTRQRVRSAWLFLTPMIIVLLLVAGWPLIRTIYFSMTDASLSDIEAHQFIWFTNFKYLLTDPDWWVAVKNTLVFTLLSVSLEVTLGLVIALALNAHMPGRGLLRASVMIPWAIPTIVSAQMWNWMFNDFYGVINVMLMGAGFIDQPIAWTADPDFSLWAVVIADVWKTTPFMALLILAALQVLPSECYEAAKVDGIHPLRVFFKVTLPLIKPALLVAVIFRCLDALRIFDLIYVLASGSRSTMSMSIYARQQLVDFQDVGYGSAASTLLFLIIAFATVLLLTIGKVKLDGEKKA